MHLFEKGLSLASRGRHGEAIQAFIESGSPTAATVFNIGNSFLALNEWHDASVWLERAAKQGIHEAWYNLGLALEGGGDDSAALVAYLHGWKHDDVGAGLAAAQLLREQQDLKSALDIVDRISGIDGEHGELATALAAVWRWEDSHDDSLESVLRESAHTIPEASIALSDLCRGSGRREEARDLLASLQRTNPAIASLSLGNLLWDDSETLMVRGPHIWKGFTPVTSLVRRIWGYSCSISAESMKRRPTWKRLRPEGILRLRGHLMEFSGDSRVRGMRYAAVAPRSGRAMGCG